MSDQPEDTTANSLGLKFESLKVEEAQSPASDEVTDTQSITAAESEGPVAESSSTEDAPQNDGTSEDAVAEGGSKSPSSPQAVKEKEKKKQPYVNPDRVKTGGAQRVRFIHLLA